MIASLLTTFCRKRRHFGKPIRSFSARNPVKNHIQALQFAKKQGIRTIFNPAPAQALDLKEIVADYVIPTNRSRSPERSASSQSRRRRAAHATCSTWPKSRDHHSGSNGALLAPTSTSPFAVEPSTPRAGDGFIAA